mmetsp:Transcript_81437/g.226850  ORF Transcript_81437/g.226850 Transcript_81437/m.226850 type:complete len:208 (-) Transcript_81437:831-1454(-)
MPRHLPMQTGRLAALVWNVPLRQPHIELLRFAGQGVPNLWRLYAAHDRGLVRLHQVARSRRDEDAPKALQQVRIDLVVPEAPHRDRVDRVAELLRESPFELRDRPARNCRTQTRFAEAQRGQAIAHFDEVGRSEHVHVVDRVLCDRLQKFSVPPFDAFGAPHQRHEGVGLEIGQLFLHRRHNLLIEVRIHITTFPVAPQYVTEVLRE